MFQNIKDIHNFCHTSKRNIVQLRYLWDHKCMICKKTMYNKKVKHLQCKHTFHLTCINQYLLEKRNRCFKCKKYIRPLVCYSDLESSDEEEDENYSMFTRIVLNTGDVSLWPEIYNIYQYPTL